MTENEIAARQKKISHAILWIVLLILFICFIFPFLLVIINVFKTHTYSALALTEIGTQLETAHARFTEFINRERAYDETPAVAKAVAEAARKSGVARE